MTNILKPADQVRRMAVLFGLLCMGVFIAPSVADASPAKNRPIKVKGIVSEKTATTITVCVGTSLRSSSKHAAALRGGPVVFDITTAKLKVRDLNGDRRKNLADLLPGARVDVRTHKAAASTSPLPARRVAAAKNTKNAKKAAEYAGGVCPSTPPVVQNIKPKPEDPRKPAPIES